MEISSVRSKSLASRIDSKTKSIVSAAIGRKSRSVSVKTIDISRFESSDEVVAQNITKCQAFMRKFWKPRQKECETVKEDLPYVCKPKKTFPTGSKYEGTWQGPWMTGYGTYEFPSGVKYEGEFKDGMFHGQGDLRYPDGVTLRAMWNDGGVTDRTVVFSDRLQYDEKDWKYCQVPDRRYKLEYDVDVQPGGASFITADQPTKYIPKGLYDTGDGYYLEKNFVYNDPEVTSILRAPATKEAKWIMKHCRKGLDGPVGPIPDYYEEWSAPQLKMKPPPPPPVKTSSQTELVKCMSTYDDDTRFMFSFINFGGSSSSQSEDSSM